MKRIEHISHPRFNKRINRLRKILKNNDENKKLMCLKNYITGLFFDDINPDNIRFGFLIISKNKKSKNDLFQADGLTYNFMFKKKQIKITFHWYNNNQLNIINLYERSPFGFLMSLFDNYICNMCLNKKNENNIK